MEEQDRTAIQSDISAGRNVGQGRLIVGHSLRFYSGKSITLDLPSEVSKILTELLNQTNHAPDELFIRSLILYKAAVDAEEVGKRMAILNSENEIDQEITGL